MSLSPSLQSTFTILFAFGAVTIRLIFERSDATAVQFSSITCIYSYSMVFTIFVGVIIPVVKTFFLVESFLRHRKRTSLVIAIKRSNHFPPIVWIQVLHDFDTIPRNRDIEKSELYFGQRLFHQF